MPDINTNKEALTKISSLFNSDKILLKQDIEEVVGALVKVLANNKKEIYNTSEQIKQQQQDLFNKVVESLFQHQQEITSLTDNHRTQTDQSTQEKLNQALEKVNNAVLEVKSYILEAQALKPENPDPEDVATLVLDKIKLPEIKDPILDTPKEIRDKLESLKKNDRLDIKYIKGWENFRDEIVNHAVTQARGLLYAGLLENGTSGTGGAATTWETPSGIVDGSNTSFTATHTPIYIISDGATYFENAGYTLSGLNITMNVAPKAAPDGFIRSFYNLSATSPDINAIILE